MFSSLKLHFDFDGNFGSPGIHHLFLISLI